MTLQFFVHNTPVEKKDAFALLESIAEDSDSPLKIDLSKYIRASFLKSKKLFDLAIKYNNKDLADLAWKFASESGEAEQARTTGPRNKLRYERALPEETKADEFIDFLLQHEAQWATGAALLLKTASTVKNCTIKEVALNYVNTTDLPNSSAALKGFNYNMDERKYEPIEANSKTERMKTFHVSPLYMSLREGLAWCRENKLVTQENTTSFGGANLVGEQAQKMQRIVYQITITAKGLDVIKEWADIDRYIDSYWARR